MYLHDRRSQGDEDKLGPPYLIAIEHEHGRCWAYQAPNKGIHGAAHWRPKRITQDWDNSGFKEVKVQLKSDQEISIVELQNSIEMVRPGKAILVNSPVGESEFKDAWRTPSDVRRRKQQHLGTTWKPT